MKRIGLLLVLLACSTLQAIQVKNSSKYNVFLGSHDYIPSGNTVDIPPGNYTLSVKDNGVDLNINNFWIPEENIYETMIMNISITKKGILKATLKGGMRSGVQMDCKLTYDQKKVDRSRESVIR